MNPISLPLLDGNTLLIDNSSLESFTTCPRSAQYNIVARRKAAGERVPLRFGGIIHKILEARYRSATALHAQSAEVEKVMAAVAETEFHGKTETYFDANGTMFEKVISPLWNPPEDDYRNYSTAMSFIQQYGLAYPFESFEIVKFPDGRSFIEVPFALPLGQIGEVNIIWTGRIDLAYTINGALYVMDHKTTSIMGPSYFTQFEIAHQLYGYAWAAEQMFGTQVTGVVINALGIRKPSKTGKAFEFQRQLVPISRSLLTEWKVDCLHIVADFIEGCRRGYLPRHTAWCVSKFGECPYRKVCTLDTDEQRQVMLNSGEFQDNTWSPLT